MPAPTKVTPLRRGDEIAQRIADYVNTQFEGNLSVAAKAIGCTYDQLRNAATGRSRPSISLVQALMWHSKRTADWWLQEEV